MVKIIVIDNGGQWTHREWRMLRDLGAHTKIFPNTTPFSDIVKEKVDGLVLSGGSPRIGLDSELGNCSEYLENADFPIVGICAGHQYIARFFGGKAAPSKIPEYGKVELIILKEDEIFEGVPKKSIVWESHNDEVTRIPRSFELLAKSENCRVQAIRHKKLPIYGLQFHPEVKQTEYGETIFRNFMNICKK